MPTGHFFPRLATIWPPQSHPAGKEKNLPQGSAAVSGRVWPIWVSQCEPRAAGKNGKRAPENLTLSVPLGEHNTEAVPLRYLLRCRLQKNTEKKGKEETRTDAQDKWLSVFQRGEIKRWKLKRNPSWCLFLDIFIVGQNANVKSAVSVGASCMAASGAQHLPQSPHHCHQTIPGTKEPGTSPLGQDFNDLQWWGPSIDGHFVLSWSGWFPHREDMRIKAPQDSQASHIEGNGGLSAFWKCCLLWFWCLATDSWTFKTTVACVCVCTARAAILPEAAKVRRAWYTAGTKIT